MIPCILARSATGDWITRRLASQNIEGILFSDISIHPPLQWLHLPMLAAMGPRPETALAWFVECPSDQSPCLPANLRAGDVVVFINTPSTVIPAHYTDNIEVIDLAVYGNEFGIEHGFVQLVGSSYAAAEQLSPLLDALAPHTSASWLHVGPAGSAGFIRAITARWEQSVCGNLKQTDSFPLQGQSQFPAPQEWAQWLRNLSGSLHEELANMARQHLKLTAHLPFSPINPELQQRITNWFTPFLAHATPDKPIASLLAEALITLNDLSKTQDVTS